jgi:hypothetical protein
VGHSNGGLVSRLWTIQRPLAGFVTVGTPNQGAPIVDRLLEIGQFNQLLYNYMGLAASAFGVQPNEWSPVFMFVQAALAFGRQMPVAALVGLATSLGLDAYAPVVPQMSPRSYVIGQLNSPFNLLHEASLPRGRIGLVYVARNFDRFGMARALDPDNADRHYLELWGSIYSLETAAAYLSTVHGGNPIALGIAGALFRAAALLRAVDATWCLAVTGDAACSVPNDGILPAASQVLPGAPNVLIVGPAHIQETRMSDDALFHAMTAQLALPPRADSPPPPPSGGGPDELLPGQALYAGQSRTSSDGRFELAFQGDGNLVLYRMADGAPLWSSGTSDPDGELDMQGDGNLVLYNGAGQAVWASNTPQFTGAKLVVQSDGNLVIYDYFGYPRWASGTAQ